MKIGTLDKDGLDLMFTVGERHDVLGATEWSIPERFRKSLQAAEESMHPRSNTNMATTLLKIFDKYEDRNKKQTLIILTDGLWAGSDSSNDVETNISEFIKNLKKTLKKSQLRWFTFQFVSFGSDDRALRRLRLLDDDLGISAGPSAPDTIIPPQPNADTESQVHKEEAGLNVIISAAEMEWQKPGNI
ncbi:hypothetical protein K4K54_012214 [Colletotrichum sp. SAR 10_86]|nr:hypothetical protein K4K54_012214 [Colletotrichum sp. SAR 10_86]